jgi:hypothetical protein
LGSARYLQVLRELAADADGEPVSQIRVPATMIAADR